MSERHHYTEFKIVWCHPAVTEEDKKDLQKDLEDSNSDVRRDVRRLFADSPIGQYHLFVFMPHIKAGIIRFGVFETAGCQIGFKKVS